MKLPPNKPNTGNPRLAGETSEFLVREIEDILDRVDALPILDTRSEAEILGYSEGEVSGL